MIIINPNRYLTNVLRRMRANFANLNPIKNKITIEAIDVLRPLFNNKIHFQCESSIWILSKYALTIQKHKTPNEFNAVLKNWFLKSVPPWLMIMNKTESIWRAPYYHICQWSFPKWSEGTKLFLFLHSMRADVLHGGGCACVCLVVCIFHYELIVVFDGSLRECFYLWTFWDLSTNINR